MLVESFVCPTCGAPERVKPEFLVVYCMHCGAMVAYDASQASANAQHRLHADARHPERTYRWLAASAAMNELLTSDPEAAARYAPVNAASMAMPSARQPVEHARALLAAWRTYYQWVRSRMVEHAEFIDPEVFARSMLRSSLRAVQGLLGDGVVARVRHEVLGDTTSHACASCGGALEGDGLGTCAHCGAVARIEVDDPWVAGVLALWAPNEQRLVSEGKLDTLEAAMTALQLGLTPVLMGTGTVKAEALFRVLSRLVPWIPRGRMVEAILFLRASATPAAQYALTGVRELIDKSWKYDPSRRPTAK